MFWGFCVDQKAKAQWRVCTNRSNLARRRISWSFSLSQCHARLKHKREENATALRSWSWIPGHFFRVEKFAMKLTLFREYFLVSILNASDAENRRFEPTQRRLLTLTNSLLYLSHWSRTSVLLSVNRTLRSRGRLKQNIAEISIIFALVTDLVLEGKLRRHPRKVFESTRDKLERDLRLALRARRCHFSFFCVLTEIQIKMQCL